ncbi:MAG: nucleotide-diphospho-sugar transferase, partial [Imperialibacter sp.]
MNTQVLLLVFNRPDTTKFVFEAIRVAKPDRLFIAADGPRADRQGEDCLCQEVRDIVSKVDWTCEVKTLYRDRNLGCKVAVSEAIDWFFTHCESGIILEDDCVPIQSFFHFASQMIAQYKDDERVKMISGTN